MNVYDRLHELGIELPRASKAAASFAMASRVGSMLFVSGHIARRDGKPHAGQLGRNVSTEEGQAAARSVAVELLATLHEAIGDLNRVRQISKVMCLVNSTPQFTEQHLVANGCSDLLVAVFGERGVHARSAFGVTQIPFGACVEIELIASLDAGFADPSKGEN